MNRKIMTNGLTAKLSIVRPLDYDRVTVRTILNLDVSSTNVLGFLRRSYKKKGVALVSVTEIINPFCDRVTLRKLMTFPQ